MAGLNSYKCIYINCNLSARGLFLLIQFKFTHKVKHNIKQLGHVCFIVSWYQNYQSVLNQWQYVVIKIYYWEIICSIGVLMRSFSNWVISFRNFDCKVMYDLRFHQFWWNCSNWVICSKLIIVTRNSVSSLIVPRFQATQDYSFSNLLNSRKRDNSIIITLSA